MGAGPTTLVWARRRGRSKTGAATWDCRLNRRRKSISDCEDHAKDHLGVKRMMEGHIGTKMRCTNKDIGSSWGKKADGNKDHRGGNMVPALFPDEEEMEFAEQPNAHIRERTVRHRVLMPHFQRAAESSRLYQGSTRESLGPIRVEDSVPTRRRGRPRKIMNIDAESLRSITGVCRCGTLIQARQGPRSVREYIEEFLESDKRCKPKSAEDWCRWYKVGLRKEIQGKLIGVLEPWKFALVNRMAGQAMNAERTLTRRVVAISSSEEDVAVEEDPSEDSEWEEEPASSPGSGRVAGSKPEGEQKSPVRSG
ncbi:hypothetical protein IGI04_002296 [Brassica rapa subsp. trilocularis]|uniref:Uncharacterized protein n=1 Tax=Brassica rapa subsp. trilocularis TaxID=1813537 RepID=A0ABQ7NV76_BRACM|nr:hypothetical protein IGI04_002296 [Brassica rapa subsp. trilocularis]